MNVMNAQLRRNWNGKPYHSLDYMLRETFGEKVYKVTLNGGMSCPNRDGKIGSRGCIFCSAGGSGDFAADAALSVTEQIDSQIAVLSAKRPIHKYIAYFQAYTNTYAPVDYLRRIFTEAIAHPSVVALSIGTRPDCLGEEVLELLDELNQIKPVWVELGLQTIHPATAEYIRRGYSLSVYDAAVDRLKARGLVVIVHVILGLPGEGREELLRQATAISALPLDILKIHQMQIIRGTALARQFAVSPFHVFSVDEYISLVSEYIQRLRADLVLERFVSQSPASMLVAPRWGLKNHEFADRLNHYLSAHGIRQGSRVV